MAKVTIANTKVGDRLKLKTNNYAIYGINQGDMITVAYKQGNYLQFDTPGGRISIPITQLDKSEETIEEIGNDIQKLKKAIKEQEDKLDWMEKTGNKVYDETEFRVWTTLKTLNSKSSDEEKAKVIAELIKKG